MNFQNNDDHFIISQELIMVMQRIIEQYSDELKEIMKKAMAQHHNEQPFDAQEAQETILDFLSLLEVLLYETNHEQKVNIQLQKQLMPSIKQIDRTSCDNEIVDSSIENASQKIEENPKANPQEVLFRELLKQWKPSKETVKH
ncbi:TPA: hypothetical protein DIC20_02685 [Candidatus Dependentiae bacterium]|nr:MAG: hypothetical protein US03_C0017G0018 [candidate division TM6 bacterium GW2011_GWF2_36_131]KKQ02374.1 MAG: hypothetical protein US13_C0017G0018 [candidate division TM6 bacterium GW2011_GWE2_36_25]KKQ18653.1 MAG: hypothetical protein US32_C0023G0009 [candidate division TM6 bacterium GW2011_GWA2_36_9]HBR70969.1 hypothetical protein [Candidatus Dependentiae bacterium]HCU00586.1 hypothetical protein [Candidatus Dependentiae bacterium]